MIKLIREDSGVGIVCAVSKGQVFVTPLLPEPFAVRSPAPPTKSCAPSAGCGSCGGCASINKGYADKFRVYVENSKSFKIGDRIAFNRFVPEPAIMSMLVFGLPVAMAVVTMFWWFVNAPDKAESVTAVLSIAAAFFGGFIILGIIDKLFRRKYPVTLVTGSMAAGEGKCQAANIVGNDIIGGKEYLTRWDTGIEAKELAL